MEERKSWNRISFAIDYHTPLFNHLFLLKKKIIKSSFVLLIPGKPKLFCCLNCVDVQAWASCLVPFFPELATLWPEGRSKLSNFNFDFTNKAEEEKSTFCGRDALRIFFFIFFTHFFPFLCALFRFFDFRFFLRILLPFGAFFTEFYAFFLTISSKLCSFLKFLKFFETDTLLIIPNNCCKVVAIFACFGGNFCIWF